MVSQNLPNPAAGFLGSTKMIDRTKPAAEMTMRDSHAALIMASIFTSMPVTGAAISDAELKRAAEFAYRAADALIEASENDNQD